MRTLVVTNLPDELHERLRQIAKRIHRSVAKLMMQIIESRPPSQADTVNQSSTMAVRSGRPMGWKALETALNDNRYRHYTSLDESLPPRTVGRTVASEKQPKYCRSAP